MPSIVANEPRYADDLDGMDDFPLREGLRYRQRKEAELLRTISRGVMLAHGEPGSGKDLFGVSLCAMLKYYFPNRRILLDFLPKRAFGEYTLFNAQVMMQEINKMAKQAGVDGIEESADTTETAEFVEEATTHWATEGEGEVLLKNGVLYLSELKRYCYNRNPHNPFNKFIGSINSVWRHLDLLVIGTHVQPREIDKFTYLEYAKLRALCSWSMTRPYTTIVKISRGAYIGANNVWNMEGKVIYMPVDGNAPREFLGGSRFFDLYVSKNPVNLKPVLRKEMKA